MRARPTPLHTIERVDNAKGYEKGNCVWATRKEQSRNTRRSYRQIYIGKERSLAEICELTGANYKQPWSRMRLFGYSLEEAMRPKRLRKRIRRGDNHPRALLTTKDISEIKARFANGETSTQIGRLYGVGRRHISKICSGELRYENEQESEARETPKFDLSDVQ